MPGSDASTADSAPRQERSPGRPPAALAEVRTAVRRCLERLDLPAGATVGVACSGGPDSLALAAATAYAAAKLGIQTAAVVVDHGLQPGSAKVAERAARTCRELGIKSVVVCQVTPGGSAGPEGNARQARYVALGQSAKRLGLSAMLLGHTRDDQAETVLLGLARGSGARSLAGMAPVNELWARPLLGVSRATTAQACLDLGLTPWSDPHNADRRYARVRVRRCVLPVLEAELGPGIGEALARTAAQLRDDADLLAELADAAAEQLVELRVTGGEAVYRLPTDRFIDLPPALRSRVVRGLALRAGSPPSELAYAHVLTVAGLVTDWHGQGPLHLPGPVEARRSGDWIELRGRRAGERGPEPTRGRDADQDNLD